MNGQHVIEEHETIFYKIRCTLHYHTGVFTNPPDVEQVQEPDPEDPGGDKVTNHNNCHNSHASYIHVYISTTRIYIAIYI